MGDACHADGGHLWVDGIQNQIIAERGEIFRFLHHFWRWDANRLHEFDIRIDLQELLL